MTIDETISYLKLDTKEPVESSDGKITYELTQKEYASIFTLLDRNESDWLEDSEEIDNSNEDEMESYFYNKDDSRIVLKADLEKDTYTITFEENNKDD